MDSQNPRQFISSSNNTMVLLQPQLIAGVVDTSGTAYLVHFSFCYKVSVDPPKVIKFVQTSF
jgi:hypothetical protein